MIAGVLVLSFLPSTLIIALSLLFLWRKKRAYALLTFLTLPIFCSLMYILWDGYYLPDKPCRPITYPEGKRTTHEGQEILYTTDSLEKVIKFYTERLKATEVKPEASDGTWWIERRGQQLVFICMAVDINLLTAETGCVYLSEESSKTKIDIQLLRSEGTNWYCR